LPLEDFVPPASLPCPSTAGAAVARLWLRFRRAVYTSIKDALDPEAQRLGEKANRDLNRRFSRGDATKPACERVGGCRSGRTRGPRGARAYRSSRTADRLISIWKYLSPASGEMPLLHQRASHVDLCMQRTTLSRFLLHIDQLVTAFVPPSAHAAGRALAFLMMGFVVPAGRSRLHREPAGGSRYDYLSSGFLSSGLFSSFFGGGGFCAGGGAKCCGGAGGRGGGAGWRCGGAARSSLPTGGT
jgi:hypothetical protein